MDLLCNERLKNHGIRLEIYPYQNWLNFSIISENNVLRSFSLSEQELENLINQLNIAKKHIDDWSN